MNASNSTPKHNERSSHALKAMAVLLYPATWPRRLVFLGVILFLPFLIGTPLPHGLRGICVCAALISFVWASVAAVRDSRRKGNRIIGRVLVWIVGISAGGFALGLAIHALAYFAVGGSGINFWAGAKNNNGFLPYVEFFLLIATLVLLFWIPHRFFKIGLDIDGTGDAQRLLLGLITVAACLSTGMYFLLEHFGGGLLTGLRLGPLVVGIIGTMLLLAPSYRSLARACWRRGIGGIFNPRTLKEHWGKALTELSEALDLETGREATSRTDPGPAHEKTA
jgi:hypothetical protein